MAAIIALVMLYPFKTTVVPAWRLRVVDEKDSPYGGKQVRQAWKHYSIEINGTDNLDDRWTDTDGYVTFPERSIRASILRRIVFTSFSAVMTLAHGSMGIHARVAATGPKGYTSVEYIQGTPPPKRLVLPSEESEILSTQWPRSLKVFLR
jgi:hypothetical protein